MTTWTTWVPRTPAAPLQSQTGTWAPRYNAGSGYGTGGYSSGGFGTGAATLPAAQALSGSWARRS